MVQWGRGEYIPNHPEVAWCPCQVHIHTFPARGAQESDHADSSWELWSCVWLSWNSLCRPGWPWTQKSACLCLPSAGIKGVHHHAHLVWIFHLTFFFSRKREKEDMEMEHRGRLISEFKASLFYKMSSRTARAIQRDPVSKNKNKTKKQKKKKNAQQFWICIGP